MNKTYSYRNFKIIGIAIAINLCLSFIAYIAGLIVTDSASLTLEAFISLIYFAEALVLCYALSTVSARLINSRLRRKIASTS